MIERQQMTVDIKRTTGTTTETIATVPITEGSRRKYTLQAEDYVQLDFSITEPIFFRLGDFINDELFGYFEVTNLQMPSFDESTGAYNYELKLNAPYIKWKNKICKYIPDATSKETSFTLTSTIDVHLAVITRNLTALGITYNGKAYSVNFESYNINNVIDTTASKYVQYQDLSIYEALNKIADAYECEWWVDGAVIYFGTCLINGEATELEIGKNLVTMSRSGKESDAAATRIYAFGSDKNLPTTYRNDSGVDVTKDGVVQKRLMLPLDTNPDGSIQDTEVTTEDQAVEKVLIFDDIYPVTYLTTSAVNSYESTTTDSVTGTQVTQTFYRVKETSGFLDAFDTTMVLNDALHIVFQTGALAGMDFEAQLTDDTTLGRCFEIVMNTTYGRELPDTILYPKAGDKWCLYNWDATKMSSLGIIETAEQKLREKALAYFEKSKIDSATYEVTMLDEWSHNDGTFKYFLIGEPVKLINDAYFSQVDSEGKHYRQSRVIGYELKLDKPYDGAQYTIGEKPSLSRIDALEQSVSSVSVNGVSYGRAAELGGGAVYLITSNDNTPASESNVYSAKRADQQFLNKKNELIKTGEDTESSDKNAYSAKRSDEEYISRKKNVDVSGIPNFKTGIKILNDLVGQLIKNVDDLQEIDDAVLSAAKAANSFIRKDQEDITRYVVNFLNGLISKSVSSQNFVSGLAGAGFKIEQRADGSSYAEIDNLIVRVKAIFQELEIRKLSYSGGNIIFSAAGSVIKSAESTEVDGVKVYRCYLNTDDGTSRTRNWWKVGDLARCQTLNMKAEAAKNTKLYTHNGRPLTNLGKLLTYIETTWSNVSNKYYWRKVVAVGDDYVDLSVEDCQQYDRGQDNGGFPANEEGRLKCDEPSAGDEIVQMGNSIDATRDGFIIMNVVSDEGVSFDMYQGVNSYTLVGKRIMRMSPKGGVELNSRYFVLSNDIDNVYSRMTNYRGEYDKDAHYVWYDEVSYEGSKYYVSNSDYDGSTTAKYAHGIAPTDSSVWQMSVKKGDDGTTITKTATTYAITDNATDTPSYSYNSIKDAASAIKQGQYLWTKTTTTYSNADAKDEVSVSRFGADGQTGKSPYISNGYWYYWDGTQFVKGDKAQGETGSSITLDTKNSSIMYQVSNSGTSVPTDTWYTAVQATSDDKPYLWTRSIQAFSDGNSTTAYSVSYKGKNGNNGTSPTVKSSVTTYAHQKDNVSDPSTLSYGSYPSTLTQGWYLYTKTVITFSDGATATTYSTSYLGFDGKSGSTTHFAYATSSDGKTGFSTTNFSGATYIGTYTDNNSEDSTTYTDYTWTKWKGETGQTPTVTIGTNGNWFIDGVDSGQKAQGDAGHSPTVTIGSDGYWYIDGTKTSQKAQGDAGHTPTITIGADGCWWIDGSTTGQQAQGDEGHSPLVTIGTNGNWFIDGVDSGKSSIGQTGNRGASITIDSENSSVKYAIGNYPTQPSDDKFTLDSSSTASLGEYIWCRTIINYKDSDGNKITGTTTYTPSYKGTNGQGVTSEEVTTAYYVADTNVLDTSWAFTTTKPSSVADGKYLWIRTGYKITTSSGTSTIYSYSFSYQAKNGDAGVDAYYFAVSPTSLVVEQSDNQTYPTGQTATAVFMKGLTDVTSSYSIILQSVPTGFVTATYNSSTKQITFSGFDATKSSTKAGVLKVIAKSGSTTIASQAISVYLNALGEIRKTIKNDRLQIDSLKTSYDAVQATVDSHTSQLAIQSDKIETEMSERQTALNDVNKALVEATTKIEQTSRSISLMASSVDDSDNYIKNGTFASIDSWTVTPNAKIIMRNGRPLADSTGRIYVYKTKPYSEFITETTDTRVLHLNGSTPVYGVTKMAIAKGETFTLHITLRTNGVGTIYVELGSMGLRKALNLESYTTTNYEITASEDIAAGSKLKLHTTSAGEIWINKISLRVKAATTAELSVTASAIRSDVEAVTDGLQTSIEQTASAIQLEASRNTAGENLVTNPTFMSSANFWEWVGDGISIVDTGGLYSLKITENEVTGDLLQTLTYEHFYECAITYKADEASEIRILCGEGWDEKVQVNATSKWTRVTMSGQNSTQDDPDTIVVSIHGTVEIAKIEFYEKNASKIEVNQQRIALTNFQNGVAECGIDISNKKIVSVGSQFEWRGKKDGPSVVTFDANGNAIFAGILQATGGKFTGNIYTPLTTLNDSNKSSYMDSNGLIDLSKSGLNIQFDMTSSFNSFALPTLEKYVGCEVNLFAARPTVLSFGIAHFKNEGSYITTAVDSLVAGEFAKLRCIKIDSNIYWVFQCRYSNN